MRTQSVLTLLTAVVLAACGSNHEADRLRQAGADESWAVTVWGERFELFPEIDALVAGDTAEAHVHVTILDGFVPATLGSVTVVLTDASGAEERFGAPEVLRPGIFAVDIRPGSPGERQLRFEVQAGGVSESISGGRVRVGTRDAPGGLVQPPHLLPAGDKGEEVDFLKEQQWRTAFATAWAQTASLQASVRGIARIEPPAGGDVLLTAPMDAVVRAARWPHTGQRVAAGAPLLSLIQASEPTRSLAELEAAVRELEAQSTAASARAERLDQLFAREAVSRREVEQARAEATGLGARLQAAQAELVAAEAGRMGLDSVSGLEVVAPFQCRVVEILVSAGQQVAAGSPLVRVVRERPVWLRVAVTPEAADQLADGITGVVLDSGASAEAIELGAEETRLVAVAPEVDSGTGAVEVLVELHRSVDDLRLGLRTSAELLVPGRLDGIVLPDSAVVDDAGVDVVYIQGSGESFSRRVVTVQRRQGERALVTGVLPGERVVTVGGAAIRRASLLAAGSVEGHVH